MIPAAPATAADSDCAPTPAGVLPRGCNIRAVIPAAPATASCADRAPTPAGVLPTGRNIHAMDPYRMPSLSAMDRGAKAAEAILQVGTMPWHVDAHNSTASMCWCGLAGQHTIGGSVGTCANDCRSLSLAVTCRRTAHPATAPGPRLWLSTCGVWTRLRPRARQVGAAWLQVPPAERSRGIVT